MTQSNNTTDASTIDASKIEQLKNIVADKNLTPELRAAAQAQLDELDKATGPFSTEFKDAVREQLSGTPSAPIEPLREPSRDFSDYRLHRWWRSLPEPKPQFERWQNTPEVRAAIRQHDQLVDALVAKLKAGPDAKPDDVWVRIAEGHHSWSWEHPGGMSPGGKNWIMAIPAENYELWRPDNPRSNWIRGLMGEVTSPTPIGAE